MIPGEMLIKHGEIELNAGRETVTHALSAPFTTALDSVAYYGFKDEWL